MNPLNNYKHWLAVSSEYWGVPESKIVSSKHQHGGSVTAARHTFYNLCIRDKIDLYELSRAIGRNRTTVLSSVRKTNLKNLKPHIDKLWQTNQ